MKHIERFYAAVRTEMAMTLATAAEDIVTMRLVSPVEYRGAILLFTGPDSNKYRQLRKNPRCCISVGGFFAEARAEFCGPTMREDNAAMREAYDAKFPGAFAEGVTFGGRGAEFLLLHPTKLSGWAFENDVPTDDGVPNVPFTIVLEEPSR